MSCSSDWTVGDKRAMVMPWLLGSLMFGRLIVQADPPAFDTLSVLRFNAVCAHCHGGECSGCLSFALGPEAAFNHMRRYACDVDDAFARQLQAILEHMKRKCAYPPLSAPDLQGPLRRETLDAYRDLASGNYFIPLGKLKPG